MIDPGRRGDLEHSTVPALVERSAARFGARLALVDGAMELTYEDLAVEVRTAARAIAALGIDAGDRVAVWAENSARWAIIALAIQRAGGVLVPINTRFKGEEAAYVLAKSGARALFTSRGFLGGDYVTALRASGVALPGLASIVLLAGEPEGDDALGWAPFLARAVEVSEESLVARADALRPDDVCDVLFTSGTTGKPKGVLCTHAQTLRAFRDWADVTGLREGDRFLVVLPLFHSFGYKAGLLASLMMGATVLPEAVFDVGVVLARIARDRISVLPGPPTLYQSLLTHPALATHDLTSLRLAVTGAAVVPVELVERMRTDLGFGTVITGYGLTEATGVSTMCRATDDPTTIASTSGRAIPGVEVLVVDGAGDEVPRGEPGEIVIRGYTVMKGYLDDEAETAQAIDARGFLHTGDIGVMDGAGYLRITDRSKDMFIVGGFNAYPAEIEGVLARHPAVLHAAVVGMPDERQGEVGAAFVVLRAGAVATPDELISFCRERIANYKVPRRVELVDALPLNASGKVLKHRLRDRVRGLSA